MGTHLPSSRKGSLLSRRSLVATSVSACGLFLTPAVRAAATPPRQIKFTNLHTGERVDTVYWADGAYVAEGLRRINRVLRDHRTEAEYPIDRRLLDLLNQLGTKLETKNTFDVISGYRSPASNAKLHAASSGVATRSLHMDGMAIDIRMPGVELKNVHRAALDIAGGGVGYYEQSQFVHVDVGRVRRW
jgi:uncharacterized protein YcbK (DUF882 family)